MKDPLPGGFYSLPTEDPLLCPREEKAELETSNCVVQLEYIEYLVRDLKIDEIRESHVKELHKLAIAGLYACGGEYQRWTRSAELHGGGATHDPPEPARIPALVHEALARINDTSVHPLERAGYALWRFNWIHPFAGGNGRTSRALAYLVLCIDSGRCIPGSPSFPTRIAERQEDYVQALRIADEGELAGTERIAPICVLVCEAAIASLEAAFATPK